MHTIKDDHDFLATAMKAYDNPSCITVDEFNRDLYMITNIRKSIRKYLNAEEVNIRLLVNYFVVLYNCFGSKATELLFYKITEKEHKAVMIPIITFIGRAGADVPVEDINTSIVQELMAL